MTSVLQAIHMKKSLFLTIYITVLLFNYSYADDDIYVIKAADGIETTTTYNYCFKRASYDYSTDKTEYISEATLAKIKALQSDGDTAKNGKLLGKECVKSAADANHTVPIIECAYNGQKNLNGAKNSSANKVAKPIRQLAGYGRRIILV